MVLSLGRTFGSASNRVERELLAHGLWFMLLRTVFSSWHHIQIQVSFYRYFSKFLSQALLGSVSCLVRCMFFYHWKIPFDSNNNNNNNNGKILGTLVSIFKWPSNRWGILNTSLTICATDYQDDLWLTFMCTVPQLFYWNNSCPPWLELRLECW